MVKVIVPANAKGGGSLNVQAPNGQIVRVVLPETTKPGIV